MRTILGTAILLWIGTPAIAHRLDEYLQATLISLEKDRVQAQIRLAPGVAVLPIVLAKIDADADGSISAAEQNRYAESVLRDLSLTVDGERLRLRLLSTRFPKVEEMQEGRGEIQLEVIADVPLSGRNRRLVFENHHEGAIGAYLINTLIPRDPDIRITAQNRNYQQSFYQLDYVQNGGAKPMFVAWLSDTREWLGIIAFLLSVRLAFIWRHSLRVDTRARTAEVARPIAGSQFLISSNSAITICQGEISK